MESKKLYRTEGGDKWIFGVCGGMAEYFNLDPTLVRVGWVLAAMCASIGFWGYVACAIIIPPKSTVYPHL